jgi:hypothetical protein
MGTDIHQLCLHPRLPQNRLAVPQCRDDANRRVADDACVGEGVLLGDHVTGEDDQLRAKSNRIFQDLVAAFSPALTARYGYLPAQGESLEERLRGGDDWHPVLRLAAEPDQMERSVR